MYSLPPLLFILSAVLLTVTDAYIKSYISNRVAGLGLKYRDWDKIFASMWDPSLPPYVWPDSGPALTTELSSAGHLSLDAQGNVFFSDSGKIRKVDIYGQMTTVAGLGELVVSFQDRTPKPAIDSRIGWADGLWVDSNPSPNIYYVGGADYSGVYRIDTATGLHHFVAGCGYSLSGWAAKSYVADNVPGTEACFSWFAGIWGDYDNKYLYISDQGNHRVRVIDLTSSNYNTRILPVYTGNPGMDFSPRNIWGSRDGALYVSSEWEGQIIKIPNPITSSEYSILIGGVFDYSFSSKPYDGMTYYSMFPMGAQINGFTGDDQGNLYFQRNSQIMQLELATNKLYILAGYDWNTQVDWSQENGTPGELLLVDGAANLAFRDGMLYVPMGSSGLIVTLSQPNTPTRAPAFPPSHIVATNAPSTEPTVAPSATPTIAPTAGPTDAPTFKPSFKPSFKPFALPTSRPSSIPTPSPTPVPSPNPSAVPTVPPTAIPTAPPSHVPTASPTAAPSDRPTASPTAAPSDRPTAAPTVLPTAAPSAKPTVVPTTAPSAVPTVAPTTVPTAHPSAAPSAIPTDAPTFAPSFASSGAAISTSISQVTFAISGLSSSGLTQTQQQALRQALLTAMKADLALTTSQNVAYQGTVNSQKNKRALLEVDEEVEDIVHVLLTVTIPLGDDRAFAHNNITIVPAVVEHAIADAVASGELNEFLEGFSSNHVSTQESGMKVVGVSFESRIQLGGKSKDGFTATSTSDLSIYGSQSGIMIMVGAVIAILVAGGLIFKSLQKTQAATPSEQEQTKGNAAQNSIEDALAALKAHTSATSNGSFLPLPLVTPASKQEKKAIKAAKKAQAAASAEENMLNSYPCQDDFACDDFN